MTVRNTLLQAIEHNEADAKRRAGDYAAFANGIVEHVGGALGKLPGGDRVAPRYTDFAGRAIARQREAGEQLAERQAKLQSWTLRASSAKAAV